MIATTIKAVSITLLALLSIVIFIFLVGIEVCRELQLAK
jgi:hypothetical protein